MRLATPVDTEAITAYHHRCWVVAFAPLLEPGVVARMDPRGKVERWRAWLTPGSGFETMVTDEAATPVGHVTVSGHEVVHVFVDPDYWGRGLGRELLAVGEGMLRAAGHRDIELQTMVGNDRALGLYRSAGWTVTDRLVHNDLGDGITYDEHVLIKRLQG